MAARTEARAAIAAVEVVQVTVDSMTQTPMATSLFLVAASGVLADTNSIPQPSSECNFEQSNLPRNLWRVARELVDYLYPITKQMTQSQGELQAVAEASKEQHVYSQ
jgi:hypothetical protein